VQEREVRVVKSSVLMGFGSTVPLLVADTASAETEVPTVLFGLSPIETLLLFAPVTLYGIFWLYRSTLNPQAKVRTFGIVSFLTAL
jgi:hypothetical protein